MSIRELGVIPKTGQFSHCWVRHELNVNGSGRRNGEYIDDFTDPKVPVTLGTASLLFYYSVGVDNQIEYDNGSATPGGAFDALTTDEAVTYSTALDDTSGAVELRLPDGSVAGDPLHMIDGQLKYIYRTTGTVNACEVTYLDFTTQVPVTLSVGSTARDAVELVFRSEYNIRGWDFVRRYIP